MSIEPSVRRKNDRRHDGCPESERRNHEVDQMRHAMEEKLISSFSTPNDCRDISSISRHMD
jgi:uncharacterized protein Yka (UPF0111/DUF47 family)